MGITRRQFLFSFSAAGAGFILPSFFDRAVDVLARTGEPLLIPPAKTVTELIAHDYGSARGFQMNIGDPFEQPPEMTLREYVDYIGEDFDIWVEDARADGCEVDPDELVGGEAVLEPWFYQDSPIIRAERALSQLDLGPQLSGPDAVGELQFLDGGNHCDTGVFASDALTLSLLQQRLNQLATGIHIRVFQT